MSKLGTELQLLAPTALLEFFILDLTPKISGSTNKYYFHTSTNELSANVVWQGQAYTALPIEVSGYEQSTTGQFPRVRLRISNVNSLITALILNFDDLLGAKLTRKRTFARYLDAVNFTGGINPDADSSVELPDDVYFAERKVSENRDLVDIEFATSFDVDGVKLPRRQVTANVCSWAYRKSGCRYAGAVKATILGTPITVTPTNTAPFPQWLPATAYTVGQCRWYGDESRVYICSVANTGQLPTNNSFWIEDACGKKLSDCKLRPRVDSEYPFGAYPGVAQIPN